MNMASMQSALDQYKKVGVQGGIEHASPHRLIQMLMEGALDKISVAMGAMERGEIEVKGKYIGWAISIIDGLRVSLDKSIDNELVENLDSLYDYMGHRLLEANLNNDPEILAEVTKLLREIKAGWDGIAQEAAQIEEEKLRLQRKVPDIVPLHSDWQALLNVSERMLKHAQNGDWLNLAEQDLQRQSLLKKYFSSTNNNVSDILQTERILQLQTIEEELLSLCVTERASTAKELHDIHLGKTADKAYSNHA